MTEFAYNSFKQAAHFHAGRVAKPVLIVVHATAGSESAAGSGAENTQAMFADPNSRVASAHVTCDQNSIARSVHDRDTAFGAGGFNSCGLHVEQVGLTTQTSAQWEDAISRATINNAARVVRDWCGLYHISPKILTVAQVLAIHNNPACGLTGITFHADCSKAYPTTGHTDPGPGYPRSLLMQDVLGHAPTPTPPHVSNPYPRPDYANHPITHASPAVQVKWVQWELSLSIDGAWGPLTNSAVGAFQRKWFGHADFIIGHLTGDKMVAVKH